MTHFWATKSLKGGHFFLIKDDFLEDLYFDYNIHKFLGPVLQKVHFAPQVRHLRDGFNAMCDFPFRKQHDIKKNDIMKLVLFEYLSFLCKLR